MKRVLLVVLGGLAITLCFIKSYVPWTDVKNVFNSQTVVSAINIGNPNNKVIFEGDVAKINIENDAEWFDSTQGEKGSIALIKDVGGKWKQKRLQAKIIGNGELVVKLAGEYEKYPSRSVIFVDFKNLQIGDREFLADKQSGRNDKDELVFRVPVIDGQDVEISFEYRNSVGFADVMAQANLLKFFVLWAIFIYLLFLFFIYKINTFEHAQLTCRGAIW
ncbi:MAG: hypothetical protein LBC07_04130, partial [Elusimicrobiota bacterium]|nr:hypothetical protein [Elusimicrobiota bacterium]